MAAMASESATPTLHSPRGGAALEPSAAAARSPQYRRRGVVSTSPWTQIVRGPDLELPPPSSSSPAANQAAVVASSPLLSPPPPVSSGAEEQAVNGAFADRSTTEATYSKFSTSVWPDDAAGDVQPEGSDNGSGGGSNAGKKPVWNKPSNGGAEIGPVMGAELWPALSESTGRASPKLSATEVPKALPEGSLTSISAPQVDVLKGTGVVLKGTDVSSHTSKQAPSVAASSNSTPHHSHNRPRPLKRNTSNNSSSNGQVPSPSPKGSAADANHGYSGRENSRDGGQRPQLHSGNEQQQQRNSYRRGNGGPHPRGDGPHHHSYGGRRGDQDRGNQDWNPNRSFGGRDAQVQQQQHRVPARPYIRGPAPTPQPFFPPPAMSVRPIGAPIVYPDMAPMFYIQAPHPEAFRALSVVPPQIPMFFHGPDPQLQVKIVNQIEYYFSNENLIKDTYLRQNMDDQGWVPIKLISNFKKVSLLTDNIQLILDSVRNSSAVEVEGEKVRRRNDWAKWLLPSHVQHPVISSPRTFQKSSQDVLAANLHSFGLGDKTAKHGYAEAYLSPSSSGEWSSVSQQSSSDKAGQGVIQAGLPLSASNSSK